MASAKTWMQHWVVGHCCCFEDIQQQNLLSFQLCLVFSFLFCFNLRTSVLYCPMLLKQWLELTALQLSRQLWFQNTSRVCSHIDSNAATIEWETKNFATPESHTLHKWSWSTPCSVHLQMPLWERRRERGMWPSAYPPPPGVPEPTGWHSTSNSWFCEAMCGARGAAFPFHFACRNKNNKGKWYGEASFQLVHRSATTHCQQHPSHLVFYFFHCGFVELKLKLVHNKKSNNKKWSLTAESLFSIYKTKAFKSIQPHHSITKYCPQRFCSISPFEQQKRVRYAPTEVQVTIWTPSPNASLWFFSFIFSNNPPFTLVRNSVLNEDLPLPCTPSSSTPKEGVRRWQKQNTLSLRFHTWGVKPKEHVWTSTHCQCFLTLTPFVWSTAQEVKRSLLLCKCLCAASELTAASVVLRHIGLFSFAATLRSTRSSSLLCLICNFTDN